MEIRFEEAHDLVAIRSLLISAFGGPGEAGLVDALRADGDAEMSMVAVEQNEIVGHVMYSRLEAQIRAVALAPIAVAPARQGRGVGSALIAAGNAEATRRGFDVVLVLGDPAFYRRFGFDPDLAKALECNYAGPYLMLKPLLPQCHAEGRVEYPRAFGALQ